MTNLDNIEAELGRSLKLIQPDHEFVNQLQKKLSQNKAIDLETHNYAFALVTTFMGLFIGALIFWIFRKIT